MKRTVVYIGAAAILFFVWWVLSFFLALPIVPNPWSVVSCLQSIFLSSIAIHAIYSLGRIALGLVLAVGIGQVIIAVRDAVRAIPQQTYMPLLSLGASLFSIFRHVLWPASLPKFITAVRVAMATAISVLFFTETFGSQYGLGYFIMDAWLRVNYLEMYAGIVVLSLLGLLLFSMLDFIEMRICRWQYK